MNFISKAIRVCGSVATAAIFLANGASMTPLRAADDLPIVGDIPMPQVDLPEVHVDVRLGDDIGLSPPPPPRSRIVYPRGPFAAIPPARYDLPPEGPAVSQLEVARMLRSTGYSLLGQINRRGWVYTVAVLNPRGDDGRAVIDARTGAIIRFIPAFSVNARLNDELGVIYGPPGPPPPAMQDFRRAPRPPLGVQRSSQGVMQNPAKASAPKLASRTPAAVAPTAPATTSSIPAASGSAAEKPATPPAQQTAAAPQKPVDTPAAAPSPEIKPKVELLPTKEIPAVQPLD